MMDIQCDCIIWNMLKMSYRHVRDIDGALLYVPPYGEHDYYFTMSRTGLYSPEALLSLLPGGGCCRSRWFGEVETWFAASCGIAISICAPAPSLPFEQLTHVPIMQVRFLVMRPTQFEKCVRKADRGETVEHVFITKVMSLMKRYFSDNNIDVSHNIFTV